jgi:hypothetical protein
VLKNAGFPGEVPRSGYWRSCSSCRMPGAGAFSISGGREAISVLSTYIECRLVPFVAQVHDRQCRRRSSRTQEGGCKERNGETQHAGER